MTDKPIESVRLSQLETAKEMVDKAARQPGGVRVLDDTDGRYLFRLSIPSAPLPDDTSYDDAVLAIAREVIAMADDADDQSDDIVGRDAHALRVLIEERLADDIAEVVVELRGKPQRDVRAADVPAKAWKINPSNRVELAPCAICGLPEGGCRHTDSAWRAMLHEMKRCESCGCEACECVRCPHCGAVRVPVKGPLP